MNKATVDAGPSDGFEPGCSSNAWAGEAPRRRSRSGGVVPAEASSRAKPACLTPRRFEAGHATSVWRKRLFGGRADRGKPEGRRRSAWLPGDSTPDTQRRVWRKRLFGGRADRGKPEGAADLPGPRRSAPARNVCLAGAPVGGRADRQARRAPPICLAPRRSTPDTQRVSGGSACWGSCRSRQARRAPPICLAPRRFDARHATCVWRKRLGVEPSLPSKRAATGFEDREGHRAPFASTAIISPRLRGSGDRDAQAS